MKDSAIFKSYTVFVDSFVDKDDSYYMHPYGVCIANAVISSMLLSNQCVSIESVKANALEIAEMTGLDTSILQGIFAVHKTSIESFVLVVKKWELSKDTERQILRVLFEKYITKKEVGAYYTDYQTTSYITRFVVCSYLLADFVDFSSFLNRKQPFLGCYERLNSSDKEEVLSRLHDITILDPTCGTGAFVFSACEILLELYETLEKKKPSSELVRKIFEENLYGVDLDEEAICIVKFRIWLTCKLYWNISDIDLVNFKVGNTLDSSTFDWKLTFLYVFKNKHGFDCVVGNPPYVEYAKMTKKYVSESCYSTYKCGNLYSYVLERVICQLVHQKSVVGFIVPISIVSTPRMKPLRLLITKKTSNLAFANFADRPACLFNGVHQKLTIMFASIENDKEHAVYSTQYYHWTKDEQLGLMDKLTYTKVPLLHQIGVPKVSTKLMVRILKAVSQVYDTCLLDNCSSKSKWCVWLNMRMAFWGKSFVHPMESKEYKTFYLKTEKEAKLFSALMNSSLFFFIWECISDCWHITTKDLEFIKIDFSRIPNEIVEAIAELYDSYEMQLEKSKVFIGSVQTSYIYQHKLHKPMIDEIDNLIARIFYLTDEELAFIKSYQEKYRLNTERK